MKSATVFWAVLWVVILISPTPADVITLKDGTVLQGKVPLRGWDVRVFEEL